MQRQSLSDRLHANRIRCCLVTDCASVNRFAQSLSASNNSLLEAVDRVRCVAGSSVVDGDTTVLYDACKLINRALLFKFERFNRDHAGIWTISWISLATDSAFLIGLLRLICTGLGDPGNQEAGALLLCNLCMAAARDTAGAEMIEGQQKQQKLDALNTLIHEAVGPLLIIINNPPLSPLIVYAAQTLESLIQASVNCQCYTWFQSTLLLSHILKALVKLLPPSFSRSIPEVNDTQVHMERLRRLVSEGDVDLTAFSALFELLTACVCAVSPMDEERDRIASLFRTEVINVLWALTTYWPCDSCRMNNSLSWDTLTTNDASCDRLWNELDEEVAYTAESVMRCLFIMISTDAQCQQILLHHESLSEVCVHLALKLARCRTNTLPSLPTTCVIYGLRLIGQIMSLVNPNRMADHSTDHYLTEASFFLTLWLSYRMDWSMCAAEVCSTLGNIIAYLAQSPFQMENHTNYGHLHQFLHRCLLPALNCTTATNEALRLVYNMLECSTRCNNHDHYFPGHPYWNAIFVRLERFVRELVTLHTYLKIFAAIHQPDWMHHSAENLLAICELLTARSVTSREQSLGQLGRECPYLYRVCVLLSRYSVKELFEQHQSALKILTQSTM